MNVSILSIYTREAQLSVGNILVFMIESILFNCSLCLCFQHYCTVVYRIGSCFLFYSNNCCVDSFGYLSCEQQEQDHEQFEMEQRDEDLNDTDNELEHLAQHVRHDQIHFDMYVRH